MTKAKEFLERLAREFGAPFLPEGFFQVKDLPDGTVVLEVGDRDVHLDAKGEFLGSGSSVGDARGWRIVRDEDQAPVFVEEDTEEACEPAAEPQGLQESHGRNAFVCRRCDRSQSYAPADKGGGVTQEEAESLGWKLDTKGWQCPFCSIAIPVIDKIASLEHEQWQCWTDYALDKLEREIETSLLDPPQRDMILGFVKSLVCVKRWRRQIKETYEELSEREKESDRDEVRVKWDLYFKAARQKIREDALAGDKDAVKWIVSLFDELASSGVKTQG
jgi:hypothetical protein